jgi:hypothetical protein
MIKFEKYLLLKFKNKIIIIILTVKEMDPVADEEAKKAFTGEFDEEYMDTMDILDKLIEAHDSRVMCINPHED